MTECGFGSDMGMEKFFDIVCRAGQPAPSAVVLVATVKALKHHAGEPDGGLEAIERGAANMARHLANIRGFGLNAVVAVNRFPTDADEEIELVRQLALANGAYAAEANEAVARGRRGRGGARGGGRRARPTSRATSTSPTRTTRRSRRRSRRSRSRSTAPTASSCLPAARQKAEQFTRRAWTASRSAWRRRTSRSPHDPSLANAPTGFTVPVRDLRAYTGAGWIVALCGDMQTMPGLGASPAAFNVDIDADGRTVGLF